MKFLDKQEYVVCLEDIRLIDLYVSTSVLSSSHGERNVHEYSTKRHNRRF